VPLFHTNALTAVIYIIGFKLTALEVMVGIEIVPVNMIYGIWRQGVSGHLAK